METNFLTSENTSSFSNWITSIHFIFLSEKTGFDVVQTDFPNSREICFFCNNSLPIGGNIFPLLKTLTLLGGKL